MKVINYLERLIVKASNEDANPIGRALDSFRLAMTLESIMPLLGKLAHATDEEALVKIAKELQNAVCRQVNGQ